MPSRYTAVLGSILRPRQAAGWLLPELKGALARTHVQVEGLQPLQATPGDRFQGVYAATGDALNATLYLRLLLHDLVDVHVGLGVGALDEVRPRASPRDGDGPAWWNARDAREAAANRERRAGMPAGWRTAVYQDGRGHPTLESVVMLREHVLTRMDDRDVDLILSLLDGSTVTEAARAVGISQQAASLRLRTKGGYALLRSWQQLKGITLHPPNPR